MRVGTCSRNRVQERSRPMLDVPPGPMHAASGVPACLQFMPLGTMATPVHSQVVARLLSSL